MTQTGGLTLLLAWVEFAFLVGVLLWFVVRSPADPVSESRRPTPDLRDVADQPPVEES